MSIIICHKAVLQRTAVNDDVLQKRKAGGVDCRHFTIVYDNKETYCSYVIKFETNYASVFIVQSYI